MSSNGNAVVHEAESSRVGRQSNRLLHMEFKVELSNASQVAFAFKTILLHSGGLTAIRVSDRAWTVLVAVNKSYQIDEIIRALTALRDSRGRKVVRALAQRDPRNRPFGFMLPHLSNSSPNGERRPLYSVEKVRSLIDKLLTLTESHAHSIEARGYWIDEAGRTFIEAGTWVSVEAAATQYARVRAVVEELFSDPACDQFSFFLCGYGQAELVYRRH
ncbi:MAG: hypothetical protein HPKKFMNG_02040 [Planctomycetes bacterium]|nr:hypothetical protein [Planctomycetota bacterium]